MNSEYFDRFWHKWLKRSYKLNAVFDDGSGDLVVLLHGIGQTGNSWRHVVDLLSSNYRTIAFDLLGFGSSPKPSWMNYSTDDHAKTVIKNIDKQKTKPITIVGHSMGCLIAVRIAYLRPDLVKHLVLYEMPIYEGLPNKRVYRLRTDLYYRLYKRISKFEPFSSGQKVQLAQRVAKKVAGFEVDEATWPSFVKSLHNTIMNQTAASEIKKINAPTDVIYGRFDMFVIRGKPQKIFGKDSENVRAHIISERHVISKRAARFIVDRIESLNVNGHKP